MYKRAKPQELNCNSGLQHPPAQLKPELEKAFSKLILHLQQNHILQSVEDHALANDILATVKQKIEEAQSDRQEVGDDYVQPHEDIVRRVIAERADYVSPSVEHLVLESVAQGKLSVSIKFDPLNFVIESLKGDRN